MTLDRTLKVHGGLAGTRSVLSRAERIARLVEEDRFDIDGASPLGLPKVRVRTSRAGTKAKKTAEEAPAEGAEGAEGAEAVEGAAGGTEKKGKS